MTETSAKPTETATMADAPGGDSLARLQETLKGQPTVVTPKTDVTALLSGTTPVRTPDERAAAKRERDRARKAAKREAERAKGNGWTEVIQSGVLNTPPDVPTTPEAEGDAAPADPEAEGDDTLSQFLIEDDNDPTTMHVVPVTAQPEVPDIAPPAPGDVLEMQRRATIENLVAYVRPEYQAVERHRYMLYSQQTLSRLLEAFTSCLGDDPEESAVLRTFDALWIARVLDPTTVEAQRLMGAKGQHYDRVISEVQRAIGNDVVTNALAADEFQVAAKDAVRDLSVLKRLITDLDDALGYHKSFGRVDEHKVSHLAMPASMPRLLWILRHAKAHLYASVAAVQSLEEQRESQRKVIIEREQAINTARTQVAAAERRVREQIVELPSREVVWIYSIANRSYLASKILPDGVNPRGHRVPLHTLYWTTELSEGMQFPRTNGNPGSVLAVKTLDALSAYAARRRPDQIPTIAGESLSDIRFAKSVVHVPVA